MLFRKYLSIVFLLAVLILIACGKKESSVNANPEAEKITVEAANQWLNIIDNGQYAESWDLTAEMFRKAVEKKTWEKQMLAFREPLGKVINREVTKKEYMTSMPGAPDGEYVVIQYSTNFENKKNAIETITPMKDKDGKWRVSGYYIK
jgi:hypothetical protein